MDLQKTYESGNELLEQVIDLSLQEGDVNGSLGMSYYQVQDYELALEYWKKALETGLEQYEPAQIYYNIGLAAKEIALELDEGALFGKWDETLNAFRKCLELNPGHIDAYLELGRVLISAEFYLDAIKNYESVLPLLSDSDSSALVSCYMGIAAGYCALRAYTRTLNNLAKAIQIDERVKVAIGEAPGFERIKNSSFAEQFYELIA